MKNNLLASTLGAVCSLVTDGTHDTPKVISDGIPLVKAKEIVGGIINFKNAARISYDDHLKIIARSNPEFGDTLFAHIGASLGEAAYIKTKKEFSIKNVALFKPNVRIIESRYLYYYIISPKFQGEIKNSRTGSAQPFVGLNTLRNFKIVYHKDIEIQRKIASILSAYDDLIENNTRRIKILEEMAQTIYKEWFVNFRFSGYEKVRFVDSVLGKIPEGWDVKDLQDVCSRITDGSHYSPKSQEDGFPMASVKDMNDWGINIDSCRKIDEADFLKLVKADCQPLVNDILIAKDGSYLKHVFRVSKEQELVILSSIAIIRPIGEAITTFLVMYLRDETVKSRLKGFVSGAALPRIILKDFRKFKILLPASNILIAWASIIEPIFRLCEQLIIKNQNLRKTRDLLLPKLMSGEVEV